MTDSSSSQFELCYESVFHSDQGFAFPCDCKGQVQLDGLTDRARNDYLYARAMVGRELFAPAVRCRTLAVKTRTMSGAADGAETGPDLVLTFQPACSSPRPRSCRAAA